MFEFLLPLLTLLLFAKGFGEIFHHYGFSPIIGEVAVGVVFGPAVFGWFRPDAYIESVAMLGLIMLMLTSGMNSRVDLFKKVKFKATVVALGGMGVSFFLSFLVVYAGGYGVLPALFVAAALSNTATEIVARVTEGHHLHQLFVGAALIDDILAVYVLGVLSSIAIKGQIDTIGILWTTFGILMFFLFVGLVSYELIIKRNVMKILWRLEHRGIPLAFVVVFTLALAVIAQQIGLHAIIGAYMAGLFIGRMRERPKITLQSTIRLNKMISEVSGSLQSLLTPMFFVYIGLQFAPNWGAVNYVVLPVLVLAAFAGKILGCGSAASLVGHEKEAAVVGVAMIPRGALELAVIQFGLLSIAGFTQELFAMMVITTLATTLVGPILYRIVKARKAAR
ncbi:MAG: cation:proton antiporter [Candidatus Hadarchaeota archaeon]